MGRFCPWIKNNIAIEIIGRMIAEQVQRLNSILDVFEQIGCVGALI